MVACSINTNELEYAEEIRFNAHTDTNVNHILFKKNSG